jgi:hypothetical protein
VNFHLHCLWLLPNPTGLKVLLGVLFFIQP